MPRPLTQKDLDEISAELNNHSVPLIYNEKGEPCYSLWFVGTKEEFEILKRKLEI